MFQFAIVLTALTALAATAQHIQPAGYEYGNANYRYEYSVEDLYAGTDYKAEEARQGYNTDGAYQVLLPDGRRQIVTYKVSDAYSGYVADVRYEGQAREYNNKAYEPVKSSPAPPAFYPYTSPEQYPAPAPLPATYPRTPVFGYSPVIRAEAASLVVSADPDALLERADHEVEEEEEVVDVKANLDLFYGDVRSIKPKADIKIHNQF